MILFFLKKNTDVFSEIEFKQVLERLSKSDKSLWDGIVVAAHGKLNSVNDFLNTIIQIRSNIAFHYDHSGKIFRRGYISKFFGKNKDEVRRYVLSLDNVYSVDIKYSPAWMQTVPHVADHVSVVIKNTR